MRNRNDRNSFDTEMMENALKQEISPTLLMSNLPKNPLQSFLTDQMTKRNLSIDVVAELAALNRASLYKIMNNTTKHPQRNVLIRLALVLRMSFQDTQTLLRYGGRAALSGSRARDIIISEGIIKERSIEDINTRLKAHYFVDLYSKE